MLRVNKNRLADSAQQKGASLLITTIILFVLTIVAVTVSNTNQSQSIMVRNSQFRLEAFNNSYTEIDAQINVINERGPAEAIPDYIATLIDDGSGAYIASDSSDLNRILALQAPTLAQYIDPTATLVYRGEDVCFGEEISEGNQSEICHEFDLNAVSDLVNTDIESNQHQLYEYRTPN